MSTKQFFAQIDENKIVMHVSVVTAQFMADNPDRYPGTWIETFFNTPGKTYAGIGYTYDAANNNFIAPEIEAI